VEKSGIKKFFSQAAKTYSYESVEGDVTIKAKGFHMLEKLLKDNSKQDLLELNFKKMFTSFFSTEVKDIASAKIFQRQIRVNPLKMVPALVPKEKSYKFLNYIGPRRQVDINSWLKFSFKRQVIEKMPQIDPLNIPMLMCHSNLNQVTVETENSDEIKADCNYDVSLVPEILGTLPAIPYGFDPNLLSQVCKYYTLLESSIE